MKIETWLPVFPGFYGTLFDMDYILESELESETARRAEEGLPEWVDYKIDWDKYKHEVASESVDFLCTALKSLDLVSEMDIQKVISPREYNFSNDFIDILVVLTDKNKSNIKAFLKEHAIDFEEYIKDTYSSRSGFISSYSNDADDWLNEPIFDDGHVLGSIYQFICSIEDISEHDMYIYASERVYMEIEFIDKTQGEE